MGANAEKELRGGENKWQKNTVSMELFAEAEEKGRASNTSEAGDKIISLSFLKLMKVNYGKRNIIGKGKQSLQGQERQAVQCMQEEIHQEKCLNQKDQSAK